MPKLALAVSAGGHRILAARSTLGNGSDAPDFRPPLAESRRRAPGVRSAAAADAGYDSEANHRFAREELGVQSVIPAAIGRPTTKPRRAGTGG